MLDDLEAEVGEGCGEPCGVRVHELAAGELGSDGEDGARHGVDESTGCSRRMRSGIRSSPASSSPGPRSGPTSGARSRDRCRRSRPARRRGSGSAPASHAPGASTHSATLPARSWMPSGVAPSGWAPTVSGPVAPVAARTTGEPPCGAPADRAGVAPRVAARFVSGRRDDPLVLGGQPASARGADGARLVGDRRTRRRARRHDHRDARPPSGGTSGSERDQRITSKRSSSNGPACTVRGRTRPSASQSEGPMSTVVAGTRTTLRSGVSQPRSVRDERRRAGRHRTRIGGRRALWRSDDDVAEPVAQLREGLGGGTAARAATEEALAARHLVARGGRAAGRGAHRALHDRVRDERRRDQHRRDDELAGELLLHAREPSRAVRRAERHRP